MEPYSTLEVLRTQEGDRNTYSDFPQVLPVEQQGSDQPELQNPGKDAAPEVRSVYQDYNATPTAYEATQYEPTQYAATESHVGEKVTEPRICGVKRRTFFISITVAAIVIVAVVVGTVVGVLKSRPNGTSDDSPSSTAKIMDISSLAAANWTDADGYLHRAVFFQDPYNSILNRRWDSQNQTWETTNITSVMANSPTPLDALPGTPITGAALEWSGAYGTHIWFVDSNNIIRSVNNKGSTPGLWQNDTMSNANIATYPGSKLAATWQRCPKKNCVGNWVIAYQRPNDGAIETTNHTNFSKATDVVAGNAVTANTALAILPTYQGVTDSLGLITQSYSSSTAGLMQLTSWTNATHWKMNNTKVIADVPLPGSSQHAAISKWKTWTNTLCVALLSDGTVKGSWWDEKTQYSLPNITFDGGPAVNFSTIAMTVDAMLYGIWNDTILEYSVDGTDPSIFHYTGKIYP